MAALWTGKAFLKSLRWNVRLHAVRLTRSEDITDASSVGTGPSATFRGVREAGWSARHVSVPQRQSLKAKRGASPGTVSPEEAESGQGS